MRWAMPFPSCRGVTLMDHIDSMPMPLVRANVSSARASAAGEHFALDVVDPDHRSHNPIRAS